MADFGRNKRNEQAAECPRAGIISAFLSRPRRPRVREYPIMTARASIPAPWLPLLAAVTACLVWAASAHAESLSGIALVSALRQGGYVIVMRHPSSPFTVPD